jgi:hypothetical protein
LCYFLVSSAYYWIGLEMKIPIIRLKLWCLSHFQQNFSYTVAVSFPHHLYWSPRYNWNLVESGVTHHNTDPVVEAWLIMKRTVEQWWSIIHQYQQNEEPPLTSNTRWCNGWRARLECGSQTKDYIQLAFPTCLPIDCCFSELAL